MENSRAFEIKIHIRPEDIDELGHVNNIVYLRWVQDAAVAHWKALAPAEDQEKLLWVVLRHEIDYKAPARLGQVIAVRTWIGGARRLSFERMTEIRLAQDQTVLARARTLWCPVNAATGKPQRVSPEIKELFSASARDD